MKLRPRQQEAVNISLQKLTEHGDTLLVAPTGAGKTIMLSSVTGERIKNAAKGMPTKALILQHRDELTDQNTNKFRLVNPGIPISRYDADTKSWNGQAIFGMVPTLCRAANLVNFPPLNLLVIDEAHHTPAASYQTIINRAKEANPHVAIFGTTATPNRGDGAPLRVTFSNVSDQISIGELIATGHLVRPRTFVIDTGIADDLAKVKKTGDDFDMGQVSAIMDKEVVAGQIIDHWKAKAGNRKTVVFASTVAHAKHIAQAFREEGVTAETVDGAMPWAERCAVLKRYETNQTQMIVNVAVLTEGWDHPPTDCVVLLRPSSYKSTMVQMIGRGLRPVNPEEYPGVVKTDCIVLDFGLSSRKHGCLEEDANLDGEGNAVPEKGVKICPECQAEVPHGIMECPICGYQWPRTLKLGGKPQMHDFVMAEIDLLAKSTFKWVDIWGDNNALIAVGFDAWAGLFWLDGLWHAVGGTKNSMNHLGIGERIVSLALADDFLNRHENNESMSKSRRWLNQPATEKQLAILGVNPHDSSLSKYQAMCKISFKHNKRAIQNMVMRYASERKAA